MMVIIYRYTYLNCEYLIEELCSYTPHYLDGSGYILFKVSYFKVNQASSVAFYRS